MHIKRFPLGVGLGALIGLGADAIPKGESCCTKRPDSRHKE